MQSATWWRDDENAPVVVVRLSDAGAVSEVCDIMDMLDLGAGYDANDNFVNLNLRCCEADVEGEDDDFSVSESDDGYSSEEEFGICRPYVFKPPRIICFLDGARLDTF